MNKKKEKSDLYIIGVIIILSSVVTSILYFSKDIYFGKKINSLKVKESKSEETKENESGNQNIYVKRKREKEINLQGLMFSWEDEDGKLHFSNTSYPVNNPTLKVKTEIKSFKKVTKIKIRNNRILVPVTIRNGNLSHKTYMILDTGATITSIPLHILRRINAKCKGTINLTLANGKRIKGYKSKVDIIVDSQKEKNIKVAGIKVEGNENKGLLGLDFFKKRKFKIDFKKEMIVWM